METFEIILFIFLCVGIFSVLTIMFFEYLIKFLPEDSKIKMWWKRNVIDKDPYE